MPQAKNMFKAIAGDYLVWSSMRHGQDWHKWINGVVQHDILPHWAEKQVTDIQRADGIKLVTTIAARSPRQAATVSSVIGAIFELALDKGILETNPMCGLRRYVPKKSTKQLHRILTLIEIKETWDALSHGPGDEACQRAVKAILVTGQSPGSVTGMHRREINGDCWTIPAERGRVPRRVYLSPLALDLIGDQDGYIFGSGDGTRHIEVSALARLIRRVNNLPHYGLDPWTVMDLRRTVAHHMARSGVSIEQ